MLLPSLSQLPKLDNNSAKLIILQNEKNVNEFMQK